MTHQRSYSGRKAVWRWSSSPSLRESMGGNVPLSEHEQRQLDQIEQALLIVARDELFERLGHVGERNMDGYGDYRQRLRPDHHHRKGRGAPGLGERGKIFSMAGVFESRLIKRGFGDGVGHHRAHMALTNRFDRALDRFDRRRGIGRAGAPGRVFNRVFQRDDRQAV